MNAGCRRRLAPGQWWTFCGETDMGQTAPALCVDCGGEYALYGPADEANAAAEAKRARDEALPAWQATGYTWSLSKYPSPMPPIFTTFGTKWPGESRDA